MPFPFRAICNGLCLFTLMFGGGFAVAQDDAPRAYPQGELPTDVRLKPLKHLNDYFPFKPMQSPDAWAKRKEFVQRQILMANGLWPMPEKTPLKPTIHGKMDMGDYTIEKVYFQSYPGFYCTGSLYRPAGSSLKFGVKNGKRAVVLCPHGHWSNGRFYDRGEAGAKADIKNKAEVFMSAARSPLQARCVQLARMGCVVFHYDMIAYADSNQFLGHRPGVRPHMQSTEPGKWGFFSPQATLRLQDMIGLQTWNSVRSLDFVLSLPEADGNRVAVTGGSGGGTQTMLLAAIDDRVAVSVPAVMVSTAMQGGCSSENGNYMRVETGNVEFAALFAPKPQALIAADDWTKELMTKGFPELKQHYAMLNAEKHIAAQALLQFKHNYNHPNRLFMYEWFNKHLDLGLTSPIAERDFKFLTRKELTVWTDGHKLESVGDDFERKLCETLTVSSTKQLLALMPEDASRLREYRKVVGGAVDVMLGGRALSDGKNLEWNLRVKDDRGQFFIFAGVLRDNVREEELPTAFVHPKNWNKQVVVWLDPEGKRSMFTNRTTPAPTVQKLVDAGYAVAGADLFGMGEFTGDGQPISKQRLGRYGNGKTPWQQFAGYTFGFNHSVFARRTHDVMTLISFVRAYQNHPIKKWHVMAGNGSGKWVAAALAQATFHGDSQKLGRVAIDTGGFRFNPLDRFDHPDFLPGIVKYGDLPAIIALASPKELRITGEKKNHLIQNAAKVAGSNVTFAPGSGQPNDDVADWIAGQ